MGPATLTAQSRTDRLDAYFTALEADRAFNGSVLLTDDDRVVYQRSFGYADFEHGTRNSDSTRLNIASISKPFTAIAVLQLRDAGLLSLDDAYGRHVPEFPNARVTVRQLLSHTSGLIDTERLLDSALSANPGKVFGNVDLIPVLSSYGVARAFPFAPGERWSYSNAGYQLLALLIARVSHQPFAEYMRRHVFAPAGMRDSYVQTTLAQAHDANRAITYLYGSHFAMDLERLDTLGYMKRFTVGLGALNGSTNVVSSVRDLRAFDHALYGEVLLSRASIDEAFTPVRLNDGRPNVAASGAYGLGWFVQLDSAHRKTVSHSGAAPGITTFLVRDLARRRTLIILQNIQNPGFRTDPVWRLLNGEDVRYRHSAAFAYAKDLIEKGPAIALAMLNSHRADSAHFVLDEEEMDRVALELGRTRTYQAQALETYRLNTVLFPASFRAHDNYAGALVRNGKTLDAIDVVRRFVARFPHDAAAAERLQGLLKESASDAR
jgi:CubicO group peptidase (beta-lactamase class C family)